MDETMRGGGRSSGGGSGSPRDHDLEDLLRRSQDKLKQTMPGGSGLPSSFVFLAAVVIIAIAAFFAFTFRVDPDELGIVMRFGKPLRSEPPGLHFRLPYPIEEVRLPKVTRQNIIDVGMRSSEESRCTTRTRGKSHAHWRREHRRHQFCGVLAHQGRNEISLQHPEAGGHREGGG